MNVYNGKLVKRKLYERDSTYCGDRDQADSVEQQHYIVGARRDIQTGWLVDVGRTAGCLWITTNVIARTKSTAMKRTR